jgi:hypothetical protein
MAHCLFKVRRLQSGGGLLLLRSKPLPGTGIRAADRRRSLTGRASISKKTVSLKAVRHKDFDNFDDFDGLKYLGKKFLGE